MKKVNRSVQRNGTRINKEIDSTSKATESGMAMVGKQANKKWLIPLVIALAIVPLIVVTHYYKSGLSKYPWYATGDEVYDAFLFYKSVALEIIGAVILIILTYLIPAKDHTYLREKGSIPPIIAMTIFGLMSLLSALLSKHSSDALWGGYEQFEGAFVLLAYVMCFFMAFGYVRTIELIMFFMDVLLVGSFIVGLIGTLQSFGIDWDTTSLGNAFKSIELNLRPEFKGVDFTSQGSGGVVSSTLYNPNYVGSYVDLALPLTLYLILHGKGMKRRIFAGITSAILVFLLLKSGSTAGFMGLAAGVVVCVILVLPFLKKKVRISVIAISGLALAGMIAFLLINKDIANLFAADTSVPQIADMKTDDNSVIITSASGKKLRATLDKEMMQAVVWSDEFTMEQMLSVTDESTKSQIAVTYDSKVQATITQEDYPKLSFSFQRWSIEADQSSDGLYHEFDMFCVSDGEYTWNLLDGGENGELKYYDNLYGKVDDFHKVKSAGFEGHYAMISGRGYVWSRTIPFLGKCMLTGYGPDNYLYVFPNNDYIGKMYNTMNHVVTTRPHNMFLQIWTQEGFVALLAFVFLYGLFMIRVLKMCYRRRKTVLEDGLSASKRNTSSEVDKPSRKDCRNVTYSTASIVIAVATSAYMVSGLANDSIVCVAPVFWVLLGIGYAAEAMWKKDGKADVPPKTSRVKHIHN